jgi:6-phosphogluconate dehydrogenase
MNMKKLADIGLIGLAVMGENLVLNMESKGYTVAVYNRTVSKVDEFMNARGERQKIHWGSFNRRTLCIARKTTQSDDVGKSR